MTVLSKIAGAEEGTIESSEIEFHKRQYDDLVAKLEIEARDSALPQAPTTRDALNDLHVRIRLGAVKFRAAH